MGCSQTLRLPLKDRRASVFSINRSSSTRMWIKPAGDLFTASARGCSLLALAGSLLSRAVTLSKKKGNKKVYGQATSFLNCFSPFSKECNLFTNDSQSNHSTEFLNNLLFAFSVFIHWSLEYACQSHSISHSNPYPSTAFVAYLGFINLLVAQSHPVMLLFCQLLINRDKVHQPNSESPAGAQSENRDCSKETGVASGMCFVNLVKSIKYLKHHINSRTLTR